MPHFTHALYAYCHGLFWYQSSGISLIAIPSVTWAYPPCWYCQLNTLRPRQNGCRFADNTFKCIFLNENVLILIKISLKFVPKGPINNNPALVQIMAWCRSGHKPLSEPMMVSLLTRICVTRPQWVNPLASGICGCDIKLAIFKLISRIYLEHFLWNLPSGECHKTTYRWLINIVSGNGLVLSGTSHYLSHYWWRSMSPYGITRPQRVDWEMLQIAGKP